VFHIEIDVALYSASAAAISSNVPLSARSLIERV
jgi:hypothetical protein